MRTAWRSITARGKAFLSAGVTALLCAAVFGMDDLARVGALLVALPLISALVTTRGRHRLGLARTVHPARITAGQTARVTLELSNEGRAPTGLLLLEEQVPYALGVRPRFVIDKMGPRWRRSIAYTVASDVRGRFPLGPMTVRVKDPFGMVTLDRAFSSTASLVVTPRVVELPAIPLSGSWTGSGENRPRAFAGGSAEDVTTREYRYGDDLRRVHWRSTAHAGELMVRREEQPWQSRATLLLDNRRQAHRGAGAASSLEHAVSYAASVASHLAQRGFQVRLVTADGAVAGAAWHERGGATDVAALLEELAVVAESPRAQLDTRWLEEGGHQGLVVAVLGAVGAAEVAVLDRLRHRAGTAPLGIVLDVGRWGPLSAAERRAGTAREQDESVRLLTAHGWRAVGAGPDDPLPSVWQRVGLSSRRRSTAVLEASS